VRVDSLPNATPPDPASTMDGFSSGLVVWQHDPGASGTAEIRARPYEFSSGFTPELVLSSPTLGPTEASAGLATGGDKHGDAVVAWVQGTGSSRRIVAAQLYEPPGSFAPSKSFAYALSTLPVLAWSAPKNTWGVTYQVSVDGVQVAQTSGTRLSVPDALSQGRHTWLVSAVNPAGQTSTSAPAIVFVDTLAPRVTVTLGGRRRTGSALRIRISYSDAPPGLPPRDGSGVSSVKVSWGDGTHARVKHAASHVYRRPGRYELRVSVTDRAGNVSTIKRRVKISSAP
jgi:PKD domain